MMRAPRIAWVAALGFVLTACSSTPRHAAEKIKTLPAPGNVPDAVPRAGSHSNHGNPPFYDVNGQRYKVLASAENYVERGVASWYGPDFQGHNTSSGERYDMFGMTAAHKSLPIPCYARITNLSNGRTVVVRINDRGPFVGNRIVDLSYSAATRLDMVRTGTAFVELRIVGPDSSGGAPATPTVAVAVPPAGSNVSAATPSTTMISIPVAPAGAAAPILAPAPEDSEPVATPVALYIQVGAFADEGNAQRLIQRLQGVGIPDVFAITSSDPGRTLRRIRIGPISSVEEFDRLAAQLASLGYPEARLATD